VAVVLHFPYCGWNIRHWTPRRTRPRHWYLARFNKPTVYHPRHHRRTRVLHVLALGNRPLAPGRKRIHHFWARCHDGQAYRVGFFRGGGLRSGRPRAPYELPRRGRPPWEDRYSRLQELGSDQEEDYQLSRDRSFVSDRLYFAEEPDAMRYQVDDSSEDDSSESGFDYDAEIVAQSALARIQKAREKGKPHVRLTHEELAALQLDRRRPSRPSPPIEYVRPHITPPIDGSRRRLSRQLAGPVKEPARLPSPPRSVKKKDKKDKERPAWTRQRSQPRHFSATLAGPTNYTSSKASSKSNSQSSSRRRSRVDTPPPYEEEQPLELTRHKSHGERARQSSGHRVSSWPTAGPHMEY